MAASFRPGRVRLEWCRYIRLGTYTYEHLSSITALSTQTLFFPWEATLDVVGRSWSYSLHRLPAVANYGELEPALTNIC